MQGGVDVPIVLGSRATDIKAEFGGFMGRTLLKGDVVGKCVPSAHPRSGTRSLKATFDPLRDRASEPWILRVLPGPGDPGNDFSGASLPSSDVAALVSAGVFSVTPRADRMGVCVSLDDDVASPIVGGQQMSEACASGTVQVPPDGNPVILLSEHQTTGG